MSLLLDALKKAADDKQKLSDENTAGSQRKHSGSNESIHQTTEEINVSQHKQEVVDEAELTLDTLDEKEVPAQKSSEPIHPEEGDISPEQAMLDEWDDDSLAATDENNNTKRHAISDEGLLLLINKTNREIRTKNKRLIMMVALVAIVIVIIGGAFYYSDMQGEIASLEQKHRISVQAMRVKTNSDSLPKKSEIIQNLVGDANLDEKVQFAKQQMAESKLSLKSATQKVRKNKSSSVQNPKVSIQKTRATDSVAETLDDAWLAYDDGRYDHAKKLYQQVLAVEESNRDALLGLGAIAVLNKSNNRAKEIYASLIEMNPRDPIATAAIASLRANDSRLNSDESYLLAMLQKNADAPHLNFSLANIYAKKNKWVSAQKYYFNAWQSDSENADYIYNLAVSMDQLDKKKQAIQFYKESLEQSKNKQIRFSRDAVTKRINKLIELQK